MLGKKLGDTVGVQEDLSVDSSDRSLFAKEKIMEKLKDSEEGCDEDCKVD